MRSALPTDTCILRARCVCPQRCTCRVLHGGTSAPPERVPQNGVFGRCAANARVRNFGAGWPAQAQDYSGLFFLCLFGRCPGRRHVVTMFGVDLLKTNASTSGHFTPPPHDPTKGTKGRQEVGYGQNCHSGGATRSGSIRTVWFGIIFHYRVFGRG